MALNVFKKKKEEKAKEEPKIEKAESVKMEMEFSDSPSLLRSFYVSEKANHLMSINQYTFRVVREANKREVAKQVEKMFKVKVKGVKMLNMPEKLRNVGRFSGTRSGFKKAIVTLEEGYSIAQAKA